MPILSIYFGSSEASFLAVNSLEDYKVFNYHYISTNEDFLKDLTKLAFKELGIKASDYEVITCGFPDVLGGFLSPKLSYTIDTLVTKIPSYYSIFINNFTVISPSGFLSSADLSQLHDEDINSFSNLVLYRQVIQTDTFDQINIDNMVRFLPAELSIQKGQHPFIFSGDRFSSSFKNDSMSYLLMLDMIKAPGTYSIRMDTNNILPNLAMVSLYREEMSSLLRDYHFDSVGTLINAPGGAECLVESEDGSSQMIDVKNNSIFILPAFESSRSRIVLKNSSLGNFERVVNGGKLGLVIDSRPKNDSKVFNKDYFAKNFKNWESVIDDALCTYQ